MLPFYKEQLRTVEQQADPSLGDVNGNVNGKMGQNVITQMRFMYIIVCIHLRS